MQNAFPSVANDPGYGIKQEVPKLMAISEDDYVHFLWKYTEGNAENTPVKTLVACQGSANEPTWNFVEVHIVMNPTNKIPSNYTITRNIWSNEKIVTQIPITVQMVVDQTTVLTSYIPVRTDEMDLFDSISVTTARS